MSEFKAQMSKLNRTEMHKVKFLDKFFQFQFQSVSELKSKAHVSSCAYYSYIASI